MKAFLTCNNIFQINIIPVLKLDQESIKRKNCKAILQRSINAVILNKILVDSTESSH